ncbi:unnamed protein product [Cochlearia groenlandica]
MTISDSEKRVFDQVQRTKRTLRVPFDPSSPSEQANNVERQEFHALLGGVILGFSPPPPPEPTRNRKRQRSPVSLSVQRQQRPRTKPPLPLPVQRQEQSPRANPPLPAQRQEQPPRANPPLPVQRQEQPPRANPPLPVQRQEQPPRANPPLPAQRQQQQQPRIALPLAIRPIDPIPAPAWLLPWMARKNGTNPRKVIEKTLTKTDVGAHQNRLSIPRRKIVDITFLKPEEKIIVEKEAEEGVKIEGLDVTLMVSEEKEFALNLRRWKMNNTSTYNLVTGWKGVVKACGLTNGYMIDLWSFRADDNVYFAFVPPVNPN